jgi:hypothetical protein
MNRIIEALREGMKSKLIIGTADTPSIPAHGELAVPVDVTVSRLLLKSIEVTCSKNTEFRVEFFEESEMLNSRYNSGIVQQEGYDVLDLPYMDKEESNQMYFLITNESDYDATYSIEVRGIAMK